MKRGRCAQQHQCHVARLKSDLGKETRTDYDSEADLAGAQAPMNSVLVVDDNDLVRKLIVAILEDAGITVLEAASGPEAIGHVTNERNAIGCVLQDLSMPQMPGEEIVAELLKIDPTLAIVILSVDDPAYSASKLSGLDIAGYIQKPFDTVALVSKVRGLIE